MREQKSDRAQDKPVFRDKFGKDHHRDDLGGADERAIPDYVMWDFGLPEEDQEQEEEEEE
jgi:hypothetical protein